MKKVIIYSLLLIAGLIGSQMLPSLGDPTYYQVSWVVKILSMVCLSYIMIHVGFEFDIDKSRIWSYAWDYIVAGTAATFPWLFCAFYFVYYLPHEPADTTAQIWKESLLASRFAAPTSAGVLFSMLAAAGLGASWLFRKARILAIFDDLDTIILIIPLKVMLIGFHIELTISIIIIFILLWISWRYLHQFELPVKWKSVILYSFLITLISESIYFISKKAGANFPIHIEVLLPAFVLGSALRYPSNFLKSKPEWELKYLLAVEKFVLTLVSGFFMVLVGLSMPPVFYSVGGLSGGVESDLIREMGWGVIFTHVMIITVLSNLGKMFPAFCYRKEATFRERLALAVGMFPRGEVGAGIIVISLSLGISSIMLVVATLSLALNLIMTGLFIIVIKYLLADTIEKENEIRKLSTE